MVFPGAVKRVVITTSVNQIPTPNIKFQAAKRLGNNWIIETSNYYIIPEKNKYVTRNGQFHNCQS